MNNDEILALARELEEHFMGLGQAFLDYHNPSEAWKKSESQEHWSRHLVAYNEAYRRLRLHAGSTSVLMLPGPEHKRERAFLQDALIDDSPTNSILRQLNALDDPYFDRDELEPVAQEYLSWFSDLEYAQARLVGAILVVNAGKLPADLLHFVDEIQECFAFRQYTAVYALCRTALEAGLLPVYRSNRLDHPDSANSKYVRQRIDDTRLKPWRKEMLTTNRQLYSTLTLDDFSPTLDQMITRLCWLPNYGRVKVGDELLRNMLHSIRERGNSLIHANRTADSDSAKRMMHDLFQSLHTLYEIEPHEAWSTED